MTEIANTPSPPYYAVIFTSVRSEVDDGYIETAGHMLNLARQQPGYLGVETARQGLGITVSYWRDLASITAWKQVAVHQVAQQKGKQIWYLHYCTRICLVEREYSMKTRPAD